VRNGALSALCRMGRDAVEALLPLLAAPGADVRKVAVDGLGVLGDPSVAPEVAGRLADADPNVRASAAEALGKLGGRAAEAALRGRLEAPSPDALEVSSVLVALARLGCSVAWPRLAPWVADPMTRCAALLVAARDAGTGEGPVEALSAALVARGAAVRGACLRALHGAGPRAPVCVALLSQAPRRETLARVALGLLDGTDPEVAGSAAAVSAWVAGPGTAAALLRVRHGRPWDAAVAQALDAGGPDAVVEVARALREMASEDQALALHLLMDRPDVRTAPYLATLCGQAQAEAFEMTAMALVAVDPAAGVRPLAARLADPHADHEDVAVAERVLAQLAGTVPQALGDTLAPLLEEGGEVTARILRVLALACRPQDRVTMLARVGSADQEVRLAACEGLARAGRVEDEEALAPLLADESPRVRAAAARGLGQLGARASVPALVACAGDGDPRVVGAALEALVRLDAPAASGLVLARASHGSPEVREEALRAAEVAGAVTALVAGATCLGSPVGTLVRSALRALAASGRAEAAALVQPVLADERWEVRHAAAQAMGALLAAGTAGSEARQAMEARLRVEPDALVRESLEQALAGGEGEGA
jgi:HEAT repeat protein